MARAQRDSEQRLLASAFVSSIDSLRDLYSLRSTRQERHNQAADANTGELLDFAIGELENEKFTRQLEDALNEIVSHLQTRPTATKFDRLIAAALLIRESVGRDPQALAAGVNDALRELEQLGMKDGINVENETEEHVSRGAPGINREIGRKIAAELLRSRSVFN